MLLQKRIFEWSKDLPAWQRDLLRRLTGGPLNEAAQREVLEILAGIGDAVEPIQLELRDLPSDEGEHGLVELRAVRDLSNINCLAPQQTLRFKPGLNAVFGDNGSGKSGYGRLIRRVTRSGEPEEILRDVFDPGSAVGRQTAVFDIAVDGIERPVTVDLGADPERVLSAMSAFDASRARLFLAKPNVIEHVPRPLRLLRTLVQAQDVLADVLREHAQQHRAGLTSLPEIDLQTRAGKALAGLRDDTNPTELIAQMTLSDPEKLKLEELEKAVAAIRADQGKQLESAARTQATNVRSAARALAHADAQLPVTAAGELAELYSRLEDVRAAERTLAERAFADQRFAATGQGPWQEMWFAAERFAKTSNVDFPDASEDGACPLCQQDLDAQANERMQSFQEFVSSNLRQQTIDLEDLLKARIESLPDLKHLRATTVAELRGAPEALVGVAAESLSTLDTRAVAAHNAAAGKPAEQGELELRLEELHTYANAQEALAERHAGVRDEQAQREAMSELAELRARVALVDAAQAITEHVGGLRAIAGVESMVAKLNTQRITMKLRELQEAIITERVRKAVHEEVSELDPVASRIEIKGQASKGETVIHLKFKEPCRAKVGNVLSDGEQRALCLAFFLAEIAVSEERSSIVLDDPVSSLDHDRRAYLAQRLVEESKRRQVIIFTHDMAFLHMLREAATDAEIELHGQTLQRAFHEVGVVASELPIKMDGSAKQLTALRHRLRAELAPLHKRQDPSYEQKANLWMVDLRKAYDQVIEETVLNNTVRRFSSFVQVRKLHGVKWTPEIAKRIDKAMRKASPKAHHEPLALHPGPHTPTSLRAMLDELTSLYDEIRGKPEEPAEMPSASAALEHAIRATQSQT